MQISFRRQLKKQDGKQKRKLNILWFFCSSEGPQTVKVSICCLTRAVVDCLNALSNASVHARQKNQPQQAFVLHLSLKKEENVQRQHEKYYVV